MFLPLEIANFITFSVLTGNEYESSKDRFLLNENGYEVFSE